MRLGQEEAAAQGVWHPAAAVDVAERAEEAERLHLKAVAYFCALHGRGLTDRQSCRLALRRCRDAAERAELRQEVEAAGLG